MVDYNSLVTQIQKAQQAVAQKYDAIARQIDLGREQIVKKLMEENAKAMRSLSAGKKLKNDERTAFITQLATAFSAAMSETQTLGMTAQNELRTNSMKTNSEEITKLMATVKDLSTSQGKAIEATMKTVTDVPEKLNAQWAAVEKIVNDIEAKTK